MTFSVARLVHALAGIYELVIVARAIFSWLPPEHRENEFYRFFFALTEPVLRPVRRLLPVRHGIDFSPLLVIVLLEVIRRAVRY
jgi:YggT family protein